jgi:hypothetical protein
VNGRLDLSLPKTVNATLSVTVNSGRVQIADDIPFEPFENMPREARRVRGRVNAGGLPIEVSATNGIVRVSGHE